MKGLARTVMGLWDAWVALLSIRESAFGWACFRIGVGLCLLYSLVSISVAGLVDLLWVDVADGGYRNLGPVKVLLVDVGRARPALVNAVFGVTLVGALGVTLGFGRRVVTFVTLQGYLCLTNLNRETVGSDDALLTNALWLLLLCDATKTLSVRARMSSGRWAPEQEVGAWGRFLAAFQLIVVYTFAGLNKTNTHWVPWGELDALYHVWMDPVWLRYDMSWIAYAYPLTQLGSAITWVFETFSFVMLFVFYFRYTRERHGIVRTAFNRWDLRKLFLLVGTSLHLGIFATMDVGPFSLISLTFYVCFFEPSEVRGAVDAVLRRVRPPRSAPLSHPQQT